MPTISTQPYSPNCWRHKPKGLGVHHLLGNVQEVQLRDDGAIAAVHTGEHGALRADLYIDCTGFRARLIGQALDSEFHSVSDTLFVDRALAVQVPYPRNDSPIPSTRYRRRKKLAGSGTLVYKNDVVLAMSILVVTQTKRAPNKSCATISARARTRSPTSIIELKPLSPTPWIKTVFAIGLSGGFFEPLEASGIGLVETAAPARLPLSLIMVNSRRAHSISINKWRNVTSASLISSNCTIASVNAAIIASGLITLMGQHPTKSA